MVSRSACASTLILGCLVVLSVVGLPAHGQRTVGAVSPLSNDLSETGLYVPGSNATVRSDNIAFSPQYPLWSDGTTKRRWLHIPPGTFIDGSRPDAWEFPRGTKVWKEFSYGRPIETRLIERLADGSFRYSTYVWNEAGTQARLAPAEGIRVLPVGDAPHGRYVIPAESDCRACHESAAVPLLGVSALQLSPDRDPLAPHAEPALPRNADLQALIARGWLRNLPVALRDRPPRITAPSPESRAALGYLHGNCGHCHNENGSPARSTGIGAKRSSEREELRVNRRFARLSRYRMRGMPADAPLIDAGRPETSVVIARMRSRDPLMQMPPLGTQLVDRDSLNLIEHWIRNQPLKELNR